ncbi:copi [Cystoisospora suis]|uniref:Copi n=1 Tax=Cystoisospora suis TaxID=483139 RepID=A0A2C6KT81_9APIC|nr:copi [Cystoisospora suis]
MYSSSGDVKKLLYVARKAAEAKNFTVAFLAYALTQRIDQCVDVLCEAGRYPEASFFARSYAPSRASACGDGISASSSCAVAGGAGGGEGETSNLSVQEEDLRGLPADPSLQPEKFGSLEDAVEAEKILRERYSRVIPAVTFPSMRHLLDFDILQEINQQGIQQVRNELLSASTLDEILQEESEEQHLHNKRFGGGRDSEKSYAYHHHPQRQGENVADLLTGGRDNSSIKRRDLEDRTSLGKDEGATGSGDGLVNGTSSSSSMAFPSQQGGEGGVVVDVSSLDATSSGGPPPDMVYRHHHNDVGNEGREEGDDLNLSSGNGVLLPPSSSSATTVPLPHLTSSSSGESSRFLTLQNLRQHEIEGGGAGVERGSNLTASDIRSTVTERSSYSGVLSIDGGGGGGGSMMMSTSGMSGSSGGGGGGLSSSGSSSSGSGSLATGGGEGGGGGASSSHYHHPGGHSYEDGGLSPSEYCASMAVEGRVRGVGIMRGREEGGEDRYRHHQGEEEEDDQDFIDDNEEDMQANHRIQQENRHHLPPTTMVGTQQQQHHHHHRHVFDLGHPPPSQEEEEEGTYQHMSVPSSSSRPGMTHGIGGGPGGVYGSEHTARVGLASTQQHLPGSSSSSLPSSHHPPRHPTGMVDSSGGRDGSLSSPSPGDDREQIGSEYGPSSSSSKARQNVLLGSAGLVDTAPAGSSSTQGVLTPGGMMNQGAEEEEEGRRNLIQGDYHLLHQTRTGGNQAVSAGNAGAQFLQDDFVDVLPSNEGSSTSGVGGGAGEHQRAGGEREEGSEFSFSDIEP